MVPSRSAPADLPASIGRPAMRALLAEGIENLDHLARRTEREVAALHGVGPKAIRILGEALAGRGLTFAEQARGEAPKTVG
ncbi:hypothetical protein [Rhodococcus sp. NPDC047139]|uniref:hypothetical protein n=1 Tax=Rhodococcus sp. NPDC047139 TaxID=3155141 RepID=UPI0033C004A5